jgi:hypothetical protein
MFCVVEGGDRHIRVWAQGLPGSLAVAQKSKVVGTFGVVLGLALDQAVASPKRAVPAPNGVNKGITSIAETDSDVKAYFG